MKYALVTGGSSGIGLEYARQLAEKGYHLVIVSNQEEENRGVAEEIHSCFGVDVRPLYADLSQPDSAEMVYTWCRKQALHIHILISNAGILHFGRLVNAKEEVIDRIVTLHCTTPAKLCRLFAADMSKRHDGHILLMSSMAAWLPYPTISLYGSTKTFLKNFGQALWYELRPYGVCVTTIFPGAVDTPLYQLDEKKRRLLRRVGIMTSADSLARKALRAMFKRKRRYVPGLLTRIEVFLCRILPDYALLPVLKIPVIKRILEKN